MASTPQMQKRAAARRKFEQLMASIPVIPNTTTWVDERYSKLLATQHLNQVKSADSLDLTTLKRIRKSPLYVNEMALHSNGKPIIRVYFLEYSQLRPNQLLLTDIDYDSVGRVIPTVTPHLTVYISTHAHQRVFERLRSNSATDLKAVVEKLMMLPPAKTVGEEVSIDADKGTFHLVTDEIPVAGGLKVGDELTIAKPGKDGFPTKMTSKILTQADIDRLNNSNSLSINLSSGPVWVVKTFIPAKRL